MIIRRIQVVNAGPFLGDWEVELPLGPTVVVATHEDSDVRSNRAGKSFLAVDAPLYALHGYFRGSRVEEFPHRLAAGREDAFVELEVLSSDGKSWTIRRGRNACGDPIRELNGSAVKDVDLKQVVENEIVGLSLDEHLLTTAFVQDEMHAFMRMTAAEKRRVVSPWFSTDRWVPRHDLAKRRLSKVRARLAALGELRMRHEETLGHRPQLEQRLAGLTSERGCVSSALAACRAEVDEAERSVASAKQYAEELARVREEHRQLSVQVAEDKQRACDRINRLDVAAREARRELGDAQARSQRVAELERSAQHVNALRTVAADLVVQLKQMKAAVAQAETRRLDLLERYRRLKESRTGVCPILQEPCDRIAPNPADLAAIQRDGLCERREIDRLNKVIDELVWRSDNALSDVKMAEDDVAELDRLRQLPSAAAVERRLDPIESELRRVQRDSDQLKLARTPAQRELKRMEKRIVELGAVHAAPNLERLRHLATQVRTLEQQLEEADERVAVLRAELADVDAAQQRIEEIDAEQSDLHGQIENLAWAAYAFGSAGIPSRELENAFGVAEDAMNHVLGQLRTPLRLRFSPTRELKEWEPGCLACGTTFPKGERHHICTVCRTPRRKRRRDELRLEVIDGEHTSNFDLDSGGGKVLLSLGGRLGLASLPGASRKVRCESLLIDEPDGSLDHPTRTALYELLHDRLEALGIRQVVLITHTDAKSQFGSAITVHRWGDEDRSGAWNG